MNEHQVLERLLPYVPPYWVRQALADPQTPLVGREERINAAVLFVDISGFTPISEALSRKGREGVEELSLLLERYFTVMSEPVMAYGGELAKFAGDSLIAVFPAHREMGEAHLGAALQCALGMQNAMSQFAQVRTSTGRFGLRMKIGIGEGALYNTTVGDEENGIQPVLAGLPLARCIEAEDQAEAGEIVVDAGLFSHIPGHLDFGESRGTFRLIVGATDVPVLPATNKMDVAALSPDHALLACQRLSPYLPTPLAERIRQGRQGVYGEHRRVTVMFVKFGGLNYDWDPNVGSVLQIYFKTMRDCVIRYGGRLNEVDVISDGGTLVVYFGAPTAHEDDERRAVSCAWEMQQAVADVRLAAGDAAARLRQCIGISSGTLFVGDVGAPLRRAYTAVGDEVNLASRLMGLAQWGEVVATGWVRKRTVGRFEFEAMGETQIKGKSDLVSVFALTGPRQEGGGGRLVSRLLGGRPIVGREEELALLAQVCDRAWEDAPQLVLISGEAGIGKSRLIGEVVQMWMRRGGRTFASDCHSQGSDQDFALWRLMLETIFGLQEIDSPDREREKVETLLTFISPDLADRAGLFAELLYIETAAAPDLHPRQEQAPHQLLLDLFRVLARQQPLLLVLENLQDVDSTSLSVLNNMLNRLGGLPLLICAALRLGRDPKVVETALPVTRLLLEPLKERDSLLLAQALLEDAGLPITLADLLIDQTQGHPFYLQETVSSLAGVVAAGSSDLAALLSQPLLADSVFDIIQAQLDYLDEDTKFVLRIAAVIGEEFDQDVLCEAHPTATGRRELSNRLASLERLHILRMVRYGASVTYRFRYRMVHQVVYAGMMRTDREQLHRFVAAAIQKLHADKLPAYYDLLVDHFYRGAAFSQAFLFLLMAARHAVETRDDQRAWTYYDRAEALLAECSFDSHCSDGLRLELLLERCQAHRRLVNLARAIEDGEQALALARRLTDLRSTGRAALDLAEIALGQARYLDVSVLLRQAMQSWSAFDERQGVSSTLLLMARFQALQGQFERAARTVERVVAIREQLEDDVGLAEGKTWQGAVERATGRYRQAVDAAARAVRLARRSGVPETIVHSLLEMSEGMLCRGLWGQAVELGQEALQMSRELDQPLLVAGAQRVLSHVLLDVGVYGEAYELVSAAISTLTHAEWLTELFSALCVGGEICVQLGQGKQAREYLEEAFESGRKSNTVGVIVQAQIGLSRLAVLEKNWTEVKRLCGEIRARARQAGLEPAALAARLGMAQAHLAQKEWRRARYEAGQAFELGSRLRCSYEVFQATFALGQALQGLQQTQQARHYLDEAYTAAVRLADSLPQPLAHTFMDSPPVRALYDHLKRQLAEEVA